MTDAAAARPQKRIGIAGMMKSIRAELGSLRDETRKLIAYAGELEAENSDLRQQLRLLGEQRINDGTGNAG